MAKYKIIFSKSFIKDYKKLSQNDRDLTDSVLRKLSNGEKLGPKHKDHALKGDFKGLRDCHVKPDLVLIYELDGGELILGAFRIGSHANIF